MVSANSGIMRRREFLLSSVGAGVAILARGYAATPETESIRRLLKQPVGANEKVVGMIAVTVD
jgi:hypothetical protein